MSLLRQIRGAVASGVGSCGLPSRGIASDVEEWMRIADQWEIRELRQAGEDGRWDMLVRLQKSGESRVEFITFYVEESSGQCVSYVAVRNVQ
jgi:hypothetical protein